MADEPLSQESLQALLKQHEDEKKAIREEFLETEDAKDETTEANTKKRINAIVPDALAAITYLVNNAESESVRATCAKWILEVRLGKKAPEKSSDDKIADLIESLKPKADAKTT